jgi:hypothetical protein
LWIQIQSWKVDCSDSISEATLHIWRPSLPDTITQWRQ